ncbi:uncharacterized protein LOC110457466 [Mizuhopecten yessoensis]|uniref:uncharacterized protein LOC110457466 n=1 Tax=Mizuhopecten yessoensis TaxID=6573 RepID=UPI000B45B6E8|nr:uncharacterized protein LOC110457466 [Mizuhopecten yessoensis]
MAEKGQSVVWGQGHATCVHHKGNTLDWFCETCRDVICANCISTSHKGHDIVPLSEVTPNNKRKIKTFINETEQKELIQIQQEINSNQESLEKHLSHFKSVAEEVKRKGTKLKEDIDVLTAETLSQLKHLEDENTQLLTSYKTELQMKLAELKDQLNQCKETLQTGTDIKVFDVTRRLNTDITLPRRPVLGTAKISQSKNPKEALTSALGKIILTSSGQSDYHVSAEVEKTAEPSDKQLTRPSDQMPYDMTNSTKLPTILPIISVLSKWDAPSVIKYICPASDKGAWAYGPYLHLTQLTSKGGIQQAIFSPVEVTHICMSPSTQKVWVCSREDNSVMKLKSGKWLTSSSLVRKFNTRDKPMCLCVTKDGHVLVGTKHGIIKYTREGKKSLMTTSPSTEPLMRSPMMISECPVSENVAVLDGDWSIEKHIIVLNKHLQEVYRYGPHQHGSRPESQTFYPTCVTYDRLGQLVVTDFNNNCLHLLSGDGQYLGLLYTDIYRPNGVCVDKQGVLWVVHGSNRKVKRLKYTSD